MPRTILDHINNDGAKERAGKRDNMPLYSGIYKNGKRDDIQALCCGKARNGGVCPHKGE